MPIQGSFEKGDAGMMRHALLGLNVELWMGVRFFSGFVFYASPRHGAAVAAAAAKRLTVLPLTFLLNSNHSLCYIKKVFLFILKYFAS